MQQTEMLATKVGITKAIKQCAPGSTRGRWCQNHFTPALKATPTSPGNNSTPITPTHLGSPNTCFELKFSFPGMLQLLGVESTIPASSFRQWRLQTRANEGGDHGHGRDVEYHVERRKRRQGLKSKCEWGEDSTFLRSLQHQCQSREGVDARLAAIQASYNGSWEKGRRAAARRPRTGVAGHV